MMRNRMTRVNRNSKRSCKFLLTCARLCVIIVSCAARAPRAALQLWLCVVARVSLSASIDAASCGTLCRPPLYLLPVVPCCLHRLIGSAMLGGQVKAKVASGTLAPWLQPSLYIFFSLYIHS